MSDGTVLAYGLFLPKRGGIVASEPLPTLFHYTPYLRALRVVDESEVSRAEMLRSRIGAIGRVALLAPSFLVRDGGLLDQIALVPWIEPMLAQGYAVIAVETPGYGRLPGDCDDRLPEGGPRGRPYENFGLPYHPHREGRDEPLVPGVPARLDPDFLPIAHRVASGHRLRLAIAVADDRNFVSPTPPGSTFEVRTGGETDSLLYVPFGREEGR